MTDMAIKDLFRWCEDIGMFASDSCKYLAIS
jgi:hypothetical protein